jgi:hypothetical protein
VGGSTGHTGRGPDSHQAPQLVSFAVELLWSLNSDAHHQTALISDHVSAWTACGFLPAGCSTPACACLSHSSQVKAREEKAVAEKVQLEQKLKLQRVELQRQANAVQVGEWGGGRVADGGSGGGRPSRMTSPVM